MHKRTHSKLSNPQKSLHYQEVFYHIRNSLDRLLPGKTFSRGVFLLLKFIEEVTVSLIIVIVITSSLILCFIFYFVITLVVSSGKRNVTILQCVRPSLRLSFCPVGMFTVTHKGAACDSTCVY